jgi:hypothetical protein
MRSYEGKGHREKGVTENEGCFFVSKCTYGPLHVYEGIENYKEAFKPGQTDFEVIPPNKQVCVYIDLDIHTTEDVEAEVFGIIELVRKKIHSNVRWIGTSHKTNKKSYHVLFNGTMTVQQQGSFFKEIKHEWIDISVYGKNQLLRSYQQNKPKEIRPVVDHPKYRGVSFEDRFVTYTKNTIPVPYTAKIVPKPLKKYLPKKSMVDHTLMALLRRIKRKKTFEAFLDKIHNMIQHEESTQVMSTYCISKGEICDHNASIFINYDKIRSHCHGAECNKHNERFVMDTPKDVQDYMTSNDKSVEECLSVAPRELPEDEEPFFEGFTINCVSTYHPAFQFGEEQMVYKVEREKNDYCLSLPSRTAVTNYGMGAGKTFASKENIMKNQYDRILVISCRVLQTIDFIEGATGLNFRSYQSFESYYEMSRYPRLVIQVDSIFKLKDLQYDLVFMDEAQTVLKHLVQSSTLKNPADCWYMLKEIVTMAKYLYVADADWDSSNIAHNFIHACRGDYYMINQTLKTNTKQYFEIRNAEQTVGVIDILLKMGKKVGVATSSAEFAKRLEQYFKDYNVKAIYRSNEEKHQLGDKSELQLYQLIIYSPKVGPGVDFNFHVDAVVGYFKNKRLGPNIIFFMQMLNRIRQNHTIFYCLDGNPQKKTKSHEEIEGMITTEYQDWQDLKQHFGCIDTIKDFVPKFHVRIKNQDWVKELSIQTWIETMVEKETSLRDFKTIFKERIEKSGGTFHGHVKVHGQGMEKIQKKQKLIDKYDVELVDDHVVEDLKEKRKSLQCKNKCVPDEVENKIDKYYLHAKYGLGDSSPYAYATMHHLTYKLKTDKFEKVIDFYFAKGKVEWDEDHKMMKDFTKIGRFSEAIKFDLFDRSLFYACNDFDDPSKPKYVEKVKFIKEFCKEFGLGDCKVRKKGTLYRIKGTGEKRKQYQVYCLVQTQFRVNCYLVKKRRDWNIPQECIATEEEVNWLITRLWENFT